MRIKNLLLVAGICTASIAENKTRFERDCQYLSRDTLREMANHLFDSAHDSREEQIYNGAAKRLDPKKVKAGDIIFVRSDMMDQYFTEMHPRITVPYILITHHADEACPGKFVRHLDDEKILAWFGQNPDGTKHPKFFPIPIGLASKFWLHGNVHTIVQIRDHFAGAVRNILAYLNIKERTYPAERTYVKRYFSKQPFCLVANNLKPFHEYLVDVAYSKFVLSPRGNGLDCHRTWEALIMGAIPIVRHSSLDPLFEGLPVLLINEWSEVTKEFLEEAYSEIMSRSYDYAPIYHEYWQEKIYSVRDAALARWREKRAER